MATKKTIQRDARLPSDPPQPVRIQDALATISDSAAYVSWKDAQVASGTGVVYATVEAWRNREDWRSTTPAPIQWPPPFHTEHGDAYAARLVEFLAPAATSTPSQIIAAESAVELYVTGLVGPNFTDYAWFWTGACAGLSANTTDITQGSWVSLPYSFEGLGKETDPMYCPI